MCSSPSRSIGRPANARSCSSPKSWPTTPTRFTGVKNDAASEKNEALPPSTRSARPNGVSTVSYATLPTTRMDMVSPGLRLSHVATDDRRQLPLHRGRHQLGRGDQGELEGARALAVAPDRQPTHGRAQDRARGLGVAGEV